MKRVLAQANTRRKRENDRKREKGKEGGVKKREKYSDKKKMDQTGEGARLSAAAVTPRFVGSGGGGGGGAPAGKNN